MEDNAPGTETRKVRSDRGTIRLTERDLFILTWIAEQYIVRFDQLQELLGARAGGKTQTPGKLSKSATRSAVTRWQYLNLVKIQKHLMHEPPYVWVTGHGLHVLQQEYSYLEPSPVSFPHLHAVNRVRAFVEARRPGDIWTPERQLRQEEPKSTGGHSRPHLPDGLLSGTTAIEVELSFKKKDRLVAILKGLAHTYKTVWYFCTPQTFRAVVQALKALPEADSKRFVFYDLDCNRLVVSPEDSL